VIQDHRLTEALATTRPTSQYSPPAAKLPRHLTINELGLAAAGTLLANSDFLYLGSQTSPAPGVVDPVHDEFHGLRRSLKLIQTGFVKIHMLLIELEVVHHHVPAKYRYFRLTLCSDTLMGPTRRKSLDGRA